MLFHFTYQPNPNSDFRKEITVKANDREQASARAAYVVMQSGFADRAHTIHASFR